MDINQPVVVFVTLILVVSFKNIRFDIKIKSFLQALFVFDIQGQSKKRLLFFSYIRIIQFKWFCFVNNNSTKWILKDLSCFCGAVFNVFTQDIKEFICILLLSHIYRLSVELKNVNKSLRFIKLFLWFLQICENFLEFINNKYVTAAWILKLQ